MSVNMEVTDNSKQVLSAFEQKCQRALESIGLVAEGYAKDKCPVDTGALRNSISHKTVLDDKAEYIGTNMEYAPYVELGTGDNYEGGRPDAWSWQDIKGGWHKTKGQTAQPFLRPAASEHGDEYRKIINDVMKS